MSETRPETLRKILAFAAFVEIAAGLFLIIVPANVVKSLLGLEVSSEGTLLGRFFGMAALALGLACWPGRQGTEVGSPAFRAILTYNVLITVYLVYLGTVGHRHGLLLWPSVGLHAALVFLLIWTRRAARSMERTNP